MNPVVIHRQAATSYKNSTETDKQSSLEGTSSPLQTQRSSVCKDCRFERLFVAAVQAGFCQIKCFKVKSHKLSSTGKTVFQL